MKTQIFLFIYSLLFITNLVQAQSSCETLFGVWKYETEGIEGMNILTPGHYIWVLNQKKRLDFELSDATAQDKAAAFDAMTISAGTWSCEGNRGTVVQQFTKDPKQVGTSFSFDFKIIGDKGNYWVIDSAGNRAPQGVARKVADWGEASSCSKLNGVWAYEGLNGMYIQSGIYGAWIIVDKDQASMGTDIATNIGKARAFEALDAYYAIGDCKGDHRCHWIILHSSNPAMEKQVLYTELQIQKNTFSGRFIDTDRKLVGEKWRMKRLE